MTLESRGIRDAGPHERRAMLARVQRAERDAHRAVVHLGAESVRPEQLHAGRGHHLDERVARDGRVEQRELVLEDALHLARTAASLPFAASAPA